MDELNYNLYHLVLFYVNITHHISRFGEEIAICGDEVLIGPDMILFSKVDRFYWQV